jgi:hypothetical protein
VTAWLAPTARATFWQPLAVVAASLAALCLVAANAEVWPVRVLGIAAAALATALVAGLRDPAADLLSAMPTSAARRRVRRLALLVPCGLAVWLMLVSAGHLSSAAPGLGWPFGSLVALTATGLAVAVWAPERFGVEAGVAVPMLWYAVAWAGGSTDARYAEVVFAWQHHSWMVTAVAVVALVVGRHR